MKYVEELNCAQGSVQGSLRVEKDSGILARLSFIEADYVWIVALKSSLTSSSLLRVSGRVLQHI